MNNVRQWPSANSTSILRSMEKAKNSKLNRQELLTAIESRLGIHFGVEAILFPSVRSAITSVLRFHQLDRHKTVAITKYSSHSLYTALGAFTNTTITGSDYEAIIVNHKYGYQSAIAKPPLTNNLLIVEDSCDSIFIKLDSIFYNEGLVELVSLPKVLGSYAGACILINPNKVVEAEMLKEHLKRLQNENIELGEYQSKQKRILNRDPQNFENWFYWEHKNTFLTSVDLNDITSSLATISDNTELIISRRKIVSERFGFKNWSDSRIGPVIVFPKEFILSDEAILKHEIIFSRMFDHSCTSGQSSKYTQSICLPVHFQITEIDFRNALNFISTNMRFAQGSH